MDAIDKLLQLPLYVQVVLASGYIGHLAAKHGYRSNEKGNDLLFSVMFFGLIGWGVCYLMMRFLDVHQMVGGIASVVFTACIGLVWRAKGQRLLFKILYELGISTENGIDTLWNRMQQDTENVVIRIFVTLKDGTRLACDNVFEFEGQPYYPYEADFHGNLAIYVNLRRGPEDIEWTVVERDAPDWGEKVTYIPSQEIKFVEFGVKKKARSKKPNVLLRLFRFNSSSEGD
ncbi:hypothetical protein HBA55_34595 [Pseudomaricurvus alkylphenolicus]|uniref:hypothetical protein n=1 Tax=Pseudomaricurvus alkylphenolicus TaxID=1306991 RepID=UPI0014236EF5|nr:hypothetical protein [Pseudomaricurvus alkylphenolicus]NIB44761.1 hypothetical protein [Pseudomaricurvus alkylphenolicus]